jgi:hypothetical protein
MESRAGDRDGIWILVFKILTRRTPIRKDRNPEWPDKPSTPSLELQSTGTTC